MKHKSILSRLIALGIIMVLVMGLFTACGDDGKDPVTKGKSRTADIAKKNQNLSATPTPTITGVVVPDKDNPDGDKDEKVLTMWCIAVEIDSTRHAYEAAIEEFEKNHPDITVQWNAYQNEDYKMLLRTAAAADGLPDMFLDWGGYMMEELEKSGKLYCLDSKYENHRSMLPVQMLANGTVDGHLYGVPYLTHSVVMYVNMRILQSVGYSIVPETYEEFLVCCKKIKEAGKTPIGCALKEVWCVSEVLDTMMEKTIGAKALDDIYRGRATWDNPGVAAAVDAFVDMIDRGYIGMADSDEYNDEVKVGFMTGKYAFYINGSWNSADICRYGELPGESFDVAEFPVMSSQAMFGQLYGGPSEHLCVSASAKNPDEVAEYAFEIAQLLSKYCYLDGCGIPAWSIDYSDDYINPLMKKAAERAANATALVGFGDVVMKSDDTYVYYDMLLRLIEGRVADGKEFIRTIIEQIEKNR
ncbi:MAG: extracellular solute-binding protein [Lachnospiraceae bacterium]|nr:extracellular solute-binding protein [Lachnospiraceae bacterium]